jgi:hypothetical protein
MDKNASTPMIMSEMINSSFPNPLFFDRFNFMML